MAQEPIDFAGWMKLGARENTFGNYRRAAVAFERAVAADPSSGRTHFLLGEAYGQQFRPSVDEPENLRLEELAILHFLRAIEVDRSNAEAMVWLASYPMYRGKWDEARAWYQKAIAADPSNVIAWAGLGHVILSKSYTAYFKTRWDAGLWYKSEWAPLPDAAKRAELRAQIGTDLNDAVRALERSLEIDPKHESAMAYLQSALTYRADTQGTVEECEQDIAAAQVWLDRAHALRKELDEKRRAAESTARTRWAAQPVRRAQLAPDVAERQQIYDAIPIYPEAARKAGIRGTVRILILINQEGRVCDMRPISGPEMLINAAMAAVVRWEYKPAMLHGEPVQAETEVSVNFRLP